MDDDTNTRQQRGWMVARQLAARGIRDARVIEAMGRIPRHAFVAAAMRGEAYEDSPLPIEEGQTISQPYIVALMLQEARLGADDRMLEVGAGSGYASAAASLLAAHVVAIERHAGLAASAAERLARLGFATVEVHHADGSGGCPDGAPFDAILVAASGPRVPEALRDQLALGGRLVMPVGSSVWQQRLVRLTRRGDAAFDEEDLGGVVFVPLVGEHGWPAA